MLDARGAAVPAIIHWGTDLGELSPQNLVDLANASVRAVGPSAIDRPFRLGVVPLRADGWTGLPGLEGHHDPRPGHPARRPVLTLEDAAGDDRALWFTLVDDADGETVLRVRGEIELTAGGLLRCILTVTNTADRPFELAGLASILPVPPAARERLDFTGVWAGERSPQRGMIADGTWLRESRHGRGGHDAAFVSVVGTSGFGFRTGEVWAAHVGWSGDTRYWSERTPLGATVLGLGERLDPGEVRLEPGEHYATPVVLAAWSGDGLDGISARFHDGFRAAPAHPSTPRPVTLNTWEAVYFDHAPARLEALADRAASIGVERFVLDDGWMLGRVDDRRALGDWVVDPSRWPEGLHPLVDRVHASGMQFGLWVEPEMVSLDSELARAHPDWILREGERLPPPWRLQYVLDLGNEEAFRHVRDALLALLGEYRIDYLKWDMNRDQLAGSAHRQVGALYRLIDELRSRHPGLEIESCSSGGARIDAGILARTQRVWPSDTNDAHDRQAIVRWSSLLVPLEYLGAHVGPAPAHTTGRSQSLAFRLRTALLGHAGIEWDLTSASEDELEALASWIRTYRTWRELIHTGRLVRGDDADDPVVTGVVAPDGARALFWLAFLDSPRAGGRPSRRLPGLDPARRYRIEVVDAGGTPAMLGEPPAWWSQSPVLSGVELGSVGLTMPPLLADESVMIALTALAP